MNIVPTSAAMPKQRINHSRVLSGDFFLYRLRVNDALCFLLYRTNACRMNEYILLDSRGLVGQDCQAQAVVVAGLGVANLRLRLLKLGLAQLNY
jgi:hypothetical protein